MKNARVSGKMFSMTAANELRVIHTYIGFAMSDPPKYGYWVSKSTAGSQHRILKAISSGGSAQSEIWKCAVYRGQSALSEALRQIDDLRLIYVGCQQSL
jgi:hypothetical protein